MSRRALITGAGRGLGRACAIGLANDGCDLTLVARTQRELDEVATIVTQSRQQAEVMRGDVTDRSVLEAAFDVAPVDVLVNAAGTNRPEPFVEVSEEHYREMVELNLRATFDACQVAAQRWLADGRSGVIINISSQMGHVGAPHRSVYCATKHAVEGLTKALAAELGPLGIRVASVAPTFIATRMTAAALDDPAQREAILARIPLGFLGEPEDVASAVVFVASDRARLVHGSSVVIDGGWTAQ